MPNSDRSPTHVLSTTAVRWGISTLGGQKLHPTFVMYLYLRVQQRAGKLATATATSDELLKLIEMPGNPTKPYYFPLIDRGKREPGRLLPTFWRAENISGSWSPGSIRRLQGGGWLGAADSAAYALPENHVERAREGMLYNRTVSALAIGSYFLRNDGFIISGKPGAAELVAAFRSKFDYPDDAQDEFVRLFTTDTPTDVDFPWFIGPDTPSDSGSEMGTTNA